MNFWCKAPWPRWFSLVRRGDNNANQLIHMSLKQQPAAFCCTDLSLVMRRDSKPWVRKGSSRQQSQITLKMKIRPAFWPSDELLLPVAAFAYTRANLGHPWKESQLNSARLKKLPKHKNARDSLSGSQATDDTSLEWCDISCKHSPVLLLHSRKIMSLPHVASIVSSGLQPK